MDTHARFSHRHLLFIFFCIFFYHSLTRAPKPTLPVQLRGAATAALSRFITICFIASLVETYVYTAMQARAHVTDRARLHARCIHHRARIHFCGVTSNSADHPCRQSARRAVPLISNGLFPHLLICGTITERWWKYSATFRMNFDSANYHGNSRDKLYVLLFSDRNNRATISGSGFSPRPSTGHSTLGASSR